jgi:cytochrome d ubiquinol oxidase subunit II
MLGVAVGQIASGGAGTFSFFSLLTGLFAAGLFAFLAAVYLAVEAKGALREDFRRRALGAGAAVFVLAAATAAASSFEAPQVFRGLTARAWSLPLHLATGAAAVTALAALFGRRFRLARLAAAAQVALIVLGWGASQYPVLLAPDLTLESASAPRATQVLLLWALGAGALVLFPCLYLLFRVFKGERPFSIVDRR